MCDTWSACILYMHTYAYAWRVWVCAMHARVLRWAPEIHLICSLHRLFFFSSIFCLTFLTYLGIVYIYSSARFSECVCMLLVCDVLIVCSVSAFLCICIYVAGVSSPHRVSTVGRAPLLLLLLPQPTTNFHWHGFSQVRGTKSVGRVSIQFSSVNIIHCFFCVYS